MQKKSKQIIFVFLLVVLVSLGLIFFLQKFVDLEIKTHVYLPQENNNNNENNPKIEDIKKPDDIISSTINNKDAADLSPKERCEQMKDSDGKLNCYDSLILNNVLASNLLKACDELQYTPNRQYCQDTFYKKMALSEMNVSLCENILDITTKQQCQDSLNIRIGIRNNSLETCNNIRDPEQKNTCLSQVAMKNAIVNADVAQCDLIEDEVLKQLCQNKTTQKSNTQTYLTAIKSESLAMCNSLEENLKNDCQDEINYNIAVRESNISLCTSITNQEKLSTCNNNVYTNLATTEKNVEYCQKIKDESFQENCLRETNSLLLKSAISTNDSSLCSLIADTILMEKCLNAFK